MGFRKGMGKLKHAMYENFLNYPHDTVFAVSLPAVGTIWHYMGMDDAYQIVPAVVGMAYAFERVNGYLQNKRGESACSPFGAPEVRPQI